MCAQIRSDLSGAPNRMIAEALISQPARVIQITTVKNHGVLHHSLHCGEIRAAKCPPFRGDDQCIGILQGFMRGLRKTQPGMFTQDVPSLTDGYRVVRAYRGPASQQCLDDGQAGCLAHVVGVGFEC